jgi:hypothetical protein
LHDVGPANAPVAENHTVFRRQCDYDVRLIVGQLIGMNGNADFLTDIRVLQSGDIYERKLSACQRKKGWLIDTNLVFRNYLLG